MEKLKQQELERQEAKLASTETLIRHFIEEACALIRERDETKRAIQQLLKQ